MKRILLFFISPQKEYYKLLGSVLRENLSHEDGNSRRPEIHYTK